jgi:hypothetical protein
MEETTGKEECVAPSFPYEVCFLLTMIHPINP